LVLGEVVPTPTLPVSGNVLAVCENENCEIKLKEQNKISDLTPLLLRLCDCHNT